VFVRLRKRARGVTLDLVESIRTNAGPRQRFVASFGTLQGRSKCHRELLERARDPLSRLPLEPTKTGESGPVALCGSETPGPRHRVSIRGGPGLPCGEPSATPGEPAGVHRDDGQPQDSKRYDPTLRVAGDDRSSAPVLWPPSAQRRAARRDRVRPRGTRCRALWRPGARAGLCAAPRATQRRVSPDRASYQDAASDGLAEVQGL
jgi:hypothetical protein